MKMVQEFKEQRVAVIDGNECFRQSTKKALHFAKNARINLKNSKDLINLLYHFFIVETLSLKKLERLKDRLTIVFYTTEIQMQLKSQNIFNILYKKIKSTSPIPVFTMTARNATDLPYAAEHCANQCKSNLQRFSQHINANSMRALQHLYTQGLALKTPISEDDVQQMVNEIK